MSDEKNMLSRRSFLVGGGAAMATALAPGMGKAGEGSKGRFGAESLQVWSCGGLAEAFIPANEKFERKMGGSISYTGAFAAALGKSLLGNARTEVFAPRVLKLAQTLKQQGKMLSFQPLCFTKYVLVTPKGNPAGITSIEDIRKPGVKTLCSPESSPPGGAAAMGVLKKSGVIKEATEKAIYMGSCIQHDVADVATGKADVAVVELRITRLPRYRDAFEIIEIPEKFFPAPPIPFSVGVMKWARNEEMARAFVDFICGEEGQACFEAAGFIPALSNEGERLAKKYGVKDV
ncbi:substrate-binding domain-containing protein [Salidesulfovibrio onnuriiensis]|uniref:substrate-binding domain-containing protein n=1 Tax=Salidesulfovibrio onnuriiensis TaxID=2583823 RepID=UPI0011C95576|nr:substrate-binding domain-containing protein [Salidesulfovibrio onnuriiensis]